MIIDALTSISFKEEKLVEDLQEYRKEYTVDDTLDWIYTSEGELWIKDWLNDCSISKIDDIPDWSMQEIFDYIEEFLPDE
jgi:hypothetical protein